jgi:rhodanese-related sulfurtransferase
MKTPKELVAEAKAEIREVSIEEAEGLIAEGAKIIDVREPPEVAQGFVEGARSLPRGVLEFKVDEVPELADKDATIVVYCRSGGRSALAAQSLKTLGYTNAVSMAGGFTAWSEAGKAIDRDPANC